MPLPPTRAEDRVEILFGTEVPDPFRWLEPGDDPEVCAWQEVHSSVAGAWLQQLPDRPGLAAALQRLWRYDDSTPSAPCLLSPRRFFHTKRADQDKWVLWRVDPGEEPRMVLDPNTWGATETLVATVPSPDGRYLAYSVARGGDENPVMRVLDLQTDTHLPDRLAGWRQYGVSWRADNGGFYFNSKPSPGEVAAGDEHYWHRAMWHPLHTDGSQDEVVFAHPTVKEVYHDAEAFLDSPWVLLTRTRFSRTELYLRHPERPDALVPVATGLDAEHHATILGDVLLIRTDAGAPRYRVCVADVSDPAQDRWRELVPEHPTDTLMAVVPAGGLLYLIYQHNATTRLAVHHLDGRWDHDVPLPGLGTASVSGTWTQDEVRVSWQSFVTPPVTWRYDPATRSLDLLHRAPMDIDTSMLTVEQVWITSKDGTRVPMFLMRRADHTPNGDTPTWLNGYGGFNISRVPMFSSGFALWVKAGGIVALPNLRGGGEFGASWHEAGMRERKQNVFDDFHAAAAWLIDHGYTRPGRLACSGGSNGGLLVASAVAQRPDLFRAVLCQVPLTDMLRFHHFGIANIWTQEYGSPDDPEMFPVLRAYSPYHNLPDGLDAPAVLVTGSVNDARTDPVHARKFYARLLQATGRQPEDPRPILLRIHRDSGHHGAVTIDALVDQTADAVSFLAHQTGLRLAG